MTLLVRDEEDIVRANLDFHLDRGVDFVIATDNRSEDGTVEILEEYERAGVLRLIHEPDDDYAQGRWVTRMARLAATEHGADWVINNDADEFWCPVEGDLRSTLQSVPDGTDAVLVPRFNFVVPADEADASADHRPFHERMTVRYATPFDPIKQGPIQPKMAHRAHPEARVLQGNHDVQWPGRGEVTEEVAMEILHFPIRSEAQFANKIAKGGAAYERNHDVPERYGRRWRRLLDAQRRGEFGDVYAKVVLDPPAVARGLASGELVEDRRLIDALTDGTA
ncbi:MAG: glycosyltransferase family 2 protein [Acidimicrobiales bacterium]|nr:glycosyltransferase family 2 protein [Acidimicrobiales bacterium]